MPAPVTSDINILFTRRGDPDLAVGIGEAYDTMSNRYSHTFIQIGPVRIRMYQDRNRAQRTLERVLEELKEKLGVFGGEPPAVGSGYEGEAGLGHRNVQRRTETRGGKRTRKGQLTSK